jgi:hypothetical protein
MEGQQIRREEKIKETQKQGKREGRETEQNKKERKNK